MINYTRFNPVGDTLENLLRGASVWLPDSEARAPAPTETPAHS